VVFITLAPSSALSTAGFRAFLVAGETQSHEHPSLTGLDRLPDLIHSLLKDRTSLIIAHRLSTIRQVDRILVFDSGKIVEQGRHDELMNMSDGFYRRLYEMQALGFYEDSATPGRKRRATSN